MQLVNELYMRTNCLLSDFSFSECSTLSHLFNTYYMNIYGSPLWKYYDKNLLEVFYVAWRKSLRRVWKISNVLNLSGHYTTLLMPYIQIYYDFLYKTVIRLWVKMYDISCINMTLQIVTGVKI